ncbi:hypothetical protein GGI25_005846 [Coemansia spiralis]|uniref:Inositol-pentakisphosphate 2-kinase n=1 Tax=Coemansia spiralis TaxID=417178 RepID=A0A9W8G2H0_9FUNG|nr:hypothetical protein GGI25_005846 [Coemansia spiralis]
MTENALRALHSIEAIDLVPQNWSYTGEGNASMIFAYTGTNSELSGWVLRLLKCPFVNKADSSVSSQEEIKAAAHAKNKRTREGIIYTTDVIGPLIGDKYILPQRQVSVSKSFLQQLSIAAEPFRPEHRHNKKIDLERGTAILTRNMRRRSNVQGVHSVTVEIKPKWGFLPKSESITDETAISKCVCHFCMKQFSKPDVDPGNAFCTLDLFSGDPIRIEQALDCMSRSPQGKLRIFVDDTSVLDNELLDKSLIPSWDELKKAITNIVATDKLFPRLQFLQSQLDQYGIEGILPKFNRALSAGSLTTNDPCIGEWIQAAAEFEKRCNDNGEVSDKQAVLEFLISTTLKDISVMICLEPWPTLQIDNGRVLPEYTIAIIDTDMKHISKVPEYFRKKVVLASEYLRYNPDPSKRRLCYE